MKNWKKSAVLLAGALILTACGTDTEVGTTDTSAQVDTTAAQDTTSQVTENETTAEDTYRGMLAQGREEYEAGLLDAAGGTITVLLQNDLSEYSELEAEAASLQEEIKTAQAEAAREKQETQPEESAYETERQSELAAEEFNKATGTDIQSASDEEIEQWLAEKEQAEVEQINQTTQDEEPDTEENEPEVTEEELLLQEQESVLDAVMDQLAMNPEGHEFFLVKIDEQTYQVEIRQPHAVEDVEISNMIGIFEYNMENETLKKMNPITGEFEEVSENN